jgi:hypothetical protein
MFGIPSYAFASRMPTTIGRFVVPIGVDAVDCTLGRSFSNIGEKIFKGLPAFTNGNTPTSIVRESYVARMLATVPHSSPGIESWTKYSLFRVSMFVIAVDAGIDLFKIFKSRFFVKASAAFRISPFQFLSRYESPVSAFTLAPPLNFVRWCGWTTISNEKSSKGFSDEIDGFGHLHHIGQKEDNFN